MSDVDEDSVNTTGFIGFPVGPVERRRMSAEERKRRQAIAYKKYQASHSEEIARKAKEKRLTFRDSSLPLDEIEGGGFRCRVCHGIIGSHKTFRIHERSQKHQNVQNEP